MEKKEPPGPPAPARPDMAAKRAELETKRAELETKRTEQMARQAEAQAGLSKARAEWDRMRKETLALEGSMRERRVQRQKLVADLIAEHASIRSQVELQELLQQKGVLATQSSISRDLRDLGVRRVKGVYVLKPSRSSGWSFDDVIELVELVTRSGPYTTVIQTVPGAARLVARALEETGWEEVVGMVADEQTIFVATRTEEDQNQLFERFKKYLSV